MRSIMLLSSNNDTDNAEDQQCAASSSIEPVTLDINSSEVSKVGAAMARVEKLACLWRADTARYRSVIARREDD